MAMQVRELTVGEVLDTGVLLLRDNFLFVLRVLCVLALPYFLVAQTVQTRFVIRLTDLAEIEAFDILIMEYAVMVAWGFLHFVFQFALVVPLTGGVLLYAFGQAYTGGDVPTLKQCLRGLKGRYVRLCLACLAANTAIAAASTCLWVPGILLAIYWFLYSAAIVYEDAPFTRSFGRSIELVKGNALRCLVVQLVFLVLVMFGSPAPFQVAERHWVGILFGLGGEVLRLSLGPALACAFYFSLRCQKENLDLEFMIREVESQVAQSQAVL